MAEVPPSNSGVSASMNKKDIQRFCLLFLLLCVLLGTGGCRQRIHPGQGKRQAGEQDDGVSVQNNRVGGIEGQNRTDGRAASEMNETELSLSLDEPDSESKTRENEKSSHREYDALADADIRSGEPHRIQSQGTGSGFFEYAPDALSAVSRLNAESEKSATKLNWVEESDRVSASESGAAADSALQYYRLLLEERTNSLFECKRKLCYLEMPEKYVTIQKSGQMHALLSKAGIYSASARLKENDLIVDAGWIVRKNPDMVVKIVPSGFLRNGSGKADAERILQEIRHREGFDGISAVKSRSMLLLSEDVILNPCMECAGALILAFHAYPELFDDVDLGTAIGMLRDESGLEGLTELYYAEQDGG